LSSAEYEGAIVELTQINTSLFQLLAAKKEISQACKAIFEALSGLSGISIVSLEDITDSLTTSGIKAGILQEIKIHLGHLERSEQLTPANQAKSLASLKEALAALNKLIAKKKAAASEEALRAEKSTRKQENLEEAQAIRRAKEEKKQAAELVTAQAKAEKEKRIAEEQSRAKAAEHAAISAFIPQMVKSMANAVVEQHFSRAKSQAKAAENEAKRFAQEQSTATAALAAAEAIRIAEEQSCAKAAIDAKNKLEEKIKAQSSKLAREKDQLGAQIASERSTRDKAAIEAEENANLAAAIALSLSQKTFPEPALAVQPTLPISTIDTPSLREPIAPATKKGLPPTKTVKPPQSRNTARPPATECSPAKDTEHHSIPAELPTAIPAKTPSKSSTEKAPSVPTVPTETTSKEETPNAATIATPKTPIRAQNIIPEQPTAIAPSAAEAQQIVQKKPTAKAIAKPHPQVVRPKATSSMESIGSAIDASISKLERHWYAPDKMTRLFNPNEEIEKELQEKIKLTQDSLDAIRLTVGNTTIKDAKLSAIYIDCISTYLGVVERLYRTLRLDNVSSGSLDTISLQLDALLKSFAALNQDLIGAKKPQTSAVRIPNHNEPPVKVQSFIKDKVFFNPGIWTRPPGTPHVYTIPAQHHFPVSVSLESSDTVNSDDITGAFTVSADSQPGAPSSVTKENRTQAIALARAQTLIKAKAALAADLTDHNARSTKVRFQLPLIDPIASQVTGSAISQALSTIASQQKASIEARQQEKLARIAAAEASTQKAREDAPRVYAEQTVTIMTLTDQLATLQSPLLDSPDFIDIGDVKWIDYEKAPLLAIAQQSQLIERLKIAIDLLKRFFAEKQQQTVTEPTVTSQLVAPSEPFFDPAIIAFKLHQPNVLKPTEQQDLNARNKAITIPLTENLVTIYHEAFGNDLPLSSSAMRWINYLTIKLCHPGNLDRMDGFSIPQFIVLKNKLPASPQDIATGGKGHSNLLVAKKYLFKTPTFILFTEGPNKHGELVKLYEVHISDPSSEKNQQKYEQVDGAFIKVHDQTLPVYVRKGNRPLPSAITPAETPLPPAEDQGPDGQGPAGSDSQGNIDASHNATSGATPPSAGDGFGQQNEGGGLAENMEQFLDNPHPHNASALMKDMLEDKAGRGFFSSLLRVFSR
jgi:hypothetical protein